MPVLGVAVVEESDEGGGERPSGGGGRRREKGGEESGSGVELGGMAGHAGRLEGVCSA